MTRILWFGAWQLASMSPSATSKHVRHELRLVPAGA